MTIKHLLVKYSLPFAICCTIGITILSFIKPKYIPTTGVSFSDKIGHFVAYMVLAILWLIHLKGKKHQNLIYITSGVIIYGIIIEVCQYSLTSYRSFDFYDMLANSIGALMGLSVYHFFHQQIVNVMES